MQTAAGAAQDAAEQVPRRLTFAPALIVNVLSMIGVGPFITMPLLLQAVPGPQAMLGWVLGAGIALADGLVSAELGAAFPRSGGGYRYVLEAYGPDGAGRLMSFLYLWANVATGPFLIASGAIGFSQYASWLLPGMSRWEEKLLAMAACGVA
ncbi:MAG TPA: amino acid permease, partial [Caulobacteraceae bacterium]|nr:amino acid permease [Caulobacteraceae bacterium]